MEQTDMDKLVKRFNHIVRDMLAPGADYKIVLLVAERLEDGAELTCGTLEGDNQIAGGLCEVGAKLFANKAKQERQERMNRIFDVLAKAIDDGVLTDMMKEILKKDAEEEEGREATKH